MTAGPHRAGSAADPPLLGRYAYGEGESTRLEEDMMPLLPQMMMRVEAIDRVLLEQPQAL